MKVVVDIETCQGYANCVMTAPDVFELDDQNGLARVIVENPDEDRRAAVEEAARTCPVRAISAGE